MLNKILELITDRKGKISPFKLAWQITMYSMLYLLIMTTIKTGQLPNIPENWVGFLVTVSGAQLGKSYLANKQEEVNNNKNG